MDTLYTFWDNITHYKTKSVDFWGLMNSATKGIYRPWVRLVMRIGVCKYPDVFVVLGFLSRSFRASL